MKAGCLVVLVLALAVGRPACSQLTAYAEIGATTLSNPSDTTVIAGPTFGLTDQLGTIHGVRAGFDLRAQLSGASERLDTLSLGPVLAVKHKRIRVFGEFLVGFSRYNDGQRTPVPNGLSNPNSGTTDSEIQGVGGLDLALTKRLDYRVFEYAYQEFFGVGGQFNPSTFATGVVLHFGK